MRIIVVVFICVAFPVCAQILNQDASGKSSIVWHGSSINLDASEAQIKINHYNFLKKTEKTGILWGIDLQAKNQAGLADLFSKGQFNSNSELTGVLGFRITDFEDLPRDVTAVDSDRAERSALIEPVEILYNSLVDKMITGCDVSPGVKDNDTQKTIKFLKDLTTGPWNTIQQRMTIAIVTITAGSSCKNLTPEVSALAAAVGQQAIIVRLAQLETTIPIALARAPLHVSNRTTLFYIRGGVTATGFKYDRGKSAPNFDIRFRDTTKIGALVEIGITHQFTKNFVGFSVGVEQTNNLATLTPVDYTYSQDTLLGSGKLQQQKKITAYAGGFGTYNQVLFNIDYIRMITLGESFYMAIGPYLREKSSLDTKYFKGATVFGIGFNYINGNSGKFLGGVYVQSDDISGREKLKFGESIRFGLNARFSLATIWQ